MRDHRTFWNTGWSGVDGDDAVYLEEAGEIARAGEAEDVCAARKSKTGVGVLSSIVLGAERFLEPELMAALTIRF